jgi:hypothetical protein
VPEDDPDQRVEREREEMSPEGIDHGKARPKAEAVLLILSGEPNWRPKAENLALRFATRRFAARCSLRTFDMKGGLP